jgi:DNA-binding response OmpR family regulator
MNAPAQILLVDDDRDILFGASLRLAAAGYKTITACDGDEGLESAQLNHPDAIVLDVRMPRMNGLVTLNRLRACQQTRSIPVVIVSASLVDQREALDSGAKFFLTKPYHGDALLAAVASVLNEPADLPVAGSNGRHLANAKDKSGLQTESSRNFHETTSHEP